MKGFFFLQFGTLPRKQGVREIQHEKNECWLVMLRGGKRKSFWVMWENSTRADCGWPKMTASDKLKITIKYKITHTGKINR